MYAKFVNERTIITDYPKSTVYNGMIYGNVQENNEILAHLGYKEVIESEMPQLEDSANSHYEKRYAEEDGKIMQTWVLCENLVQEEPITKWSKNKILMALIQANKAGEFLTWLSSDPIKKALWDASLTIDSNNVVFLEAKEGIKQLLGCDDNGLEAILLQCVSDLNR